MYENESYGLARRCDILPVVQQWGVDSLEAANPTAGIVPHEITAKAARHNMERRSPQYWSAAKDWVRLHGEPPTP